MSLTHKQMIILLIAILFVCPIAESKSWLSSVKDTFSISSSNEDDANQEETSGAEANNEETDYEAMCLMQRSPSWTDNPSLYFFASDLHSPSSFGCAKDLRLQLNIGRCLDPEATAQDLFMLNQTDPKQRVLNSYNGSQETYILIHGFLADWNSDTWMCKMKDMILNNSRANVFIVDWSGGAKPMLPIDYSLAVTNTQYVGQLLGDFVDWLISNSNQGDGGNFHLIGHSLGAHISGFVGYSIGSIGRITALDPAGPCFSSSGDGASAFSGYIRGGSNKRRLSPQSANFVLALHTDISLFGLNENCAHYNVYVNGGYKQPHCPTLSLTDRLGDILRLDLSNGLDLNVACAHSYAHKMVDSFSQALLGRGDLKVDQSSNRNARKKVGSMRDAADERCYPMAYECRSWDAFKAGECGFCKSNSSQCVYAGIGAYRGIENIKELNEMLNRVADGGESNDNEDSGDGASNGEQSDESDSDPMARKLIMVSKGQHFIKSDADTPTCLYHYQLVIAVQAASSQSSPKRYYYLQIPLNKQLKLVDSRGNRLNDRLVQISHEIRPNSIAHSRISDEFAPMARKTYSNNKVLNNRNGDVHYFTALITFKPDANYCRSTKESSDGTRLCRPLLGLQEARLWSSASEQLMRVRWVALNYMSSLHGEDRAKYSHLFASNGSIIKASELSATVRPSISELSKQRSFSLSQMSPLSLTSKVLAPIDCLTSSLNPNLSSGSSELNFKCGLASRELNYAVKLRPIAKSRGL